jgi:hypothetical protein
MKKGVEPGPDAEVVGMEHSLREPVMITRCCKADRDKIAANRF